MLTSQVKNILSYYHFENPGVLSNLARILMSGKLSGTGKMVILPVDQGFEHGPARSFAPNPAAYDPKYHFEIATEAGLNAYAAPLGMLEAGIEDYFGTIPLILKMNSANSLSSDELDPYQAVTASIQDALRLGCAAVGFTIYPGSDNASLMIEEVKELALEAKSNGLAVVMWSYPRGGDLTKEAETSLDVIAYAAHIAALLGANIIKVKPPTSHIILPATQNVYSTHVPPQGSLSDRIKHIMQCAFAGKRLVVFSGGTAKSTDELYQEISDIKNGGGSGSIIGRNTFQRPKEEALAMLNKIIEIYKKV